MKVRYGIIGLGNQGSSYVLNVFNKGFINNGYITALCDINPIKINYIKENYPNKEVQYFTNYIEMLESGLCDAILIEVPHYQHPEMAIECLKRNIHVLVDKPAGVYTKQVKEMNEAAKSSNALFGMMFNQRTNPLYQEMRKIIKDGGIGKLQRVTWIITNWYRPQYYYDTGSWRATWKGEGGGVLINQSPHQLDLLQWVVGETPSKITGFSHFGKWHDIEVEDDVTAYLEYDNGATGVFITTTGEAPGTNRFEVSGTLGKLVCENNTVTYFKNNEDSQVFSMQTKEAFGRPETVESIVLKDETILQHHIVINNFTEAILGKEPLFVDGLEGIKGVEIMNAILLSTWLNNKMVSLPIDENLYLNELNKRCSTSRYKLANDNHISNTIKVEDK